MANQATTVTIGSLATEMLRQGMDKDDILARLKRVFPESQTTKKCLYYYASQAGLTNRSAKVTDKKELEKLMAELKGEPTAPKKPRAKRQKKVETPEAPKQEGVTADGATV